MNALAQKTIGSVVAQNWKTASVFQKYNLDFCCKGNRTIHEACHTASIDPDQVTQEIESVLNDSESTETNYEAWPLDQLAHYIETRHHGYVMARMPELTIYLDKLCQVHGGRHPELFEIRELFAQSVGELTVHMKKEELMVFPFVKNMANAKRENRSVARPLYGTVQNPIAVMQHEHDDEGERFAKIAALSDNYTPPADACTTYRVAYKLLQEFEQDLHKHIHLENNILFPKAIALEEELTQASLKSVVEE